MQCISIFIFICHRRCFTFERGRVRRPDPLTMKKTTVSYENGIFNNFDKFSDVMVFVERGRVRRPDPLTMKKTTVSLYQNDHLFCKMDIFISSVSTQYFIKKFIDVGLLLKGAESGDPTL